jgi:hypothetical protein
MAPNANVCQIHEMKSRRWHEIFFKGYKKALNSRILLDLALMHLIHAKFLALVQGSKTCITLLLKLVSETKIAS